MSRKPTRQDIERAHVLNAKLFSVEGLTAEEHRELKHLDIRAANYEKQQATAP